MAIYDMAGAIQQPNIVGAYQQGLQFRNALADLAAKRAEEQRQIEIRNGLAQFYKAAQPEQRTMQPQGMSLLDMASIGAAGPGSVPNSPMMADRMPNAQWRAMANPSPIPAVAERVTPAVPGGFDYQGAADYLARNGEFQQAGALAKLREQFTPQGDKWLGSTVTDRDGNVWGISERGGFQKAPFQAKPEAPKAPTTRTLKVGGREVTQEWDGSRWNNIAEAPREIQKPEKPDGLDLKERAQIEQSYRKEFTGLNTAYNEIKRARGNILTSLGQNSAAGDLAAATSLMKMLDPGSVVRESELTMAQNATGAIDRMYNYAQMIANGQRLNPQQRAEYVKLANELFSSADSEYNNRRQEYSRIAMDYGLKPENIVGSAPASAPSAATPAPAPAKPAAPGQKPSLDDIFGGRR